MNNKSSPNLNKLGNLLKVKVSEINPQTGFIAFIIDDPPFVELLSRFRGCWKMLPSVLVIVGQI